jgi:hypothetical protein
VAAPNAVAELLPIKKAADFRNSPLFADKTAAQKCLRDFS